MNTLKAEIAMSKKINIGNYVFASRWSDEDPNDPWYVGRVTAIMADGDLHVRRYQVEHQSRWWPHVRRISSKEGEKILSEYPKLEITKAP